MNSHPQQWHCPDTDCGESPRPRPAVGQDFPTIIDSLPYLFNTRTGTNLQVKRYNYVAVVWQYGSNLLHDGWLAGSHGGRSQHVSPGPIQVLRDRTIPGIDIMVISSLPPIPWRPELLTLMALLLAAAQSVPAAGTVAGRVTGRAQGEPLPGVNVLVRGTTRGTTTSLQGEYRISDVPAGSYTLVFSSVGYLREVRAGVPVTDGKETVVSVSMVQTAVQAEQIVVTASKREESLEDVPVSVSVTGCRADPAAQRRFDRRGAPLHPRRQYHRDPGQHPRIQRLQPRRRKPGADAPRRRAVPGRGYGGAQL